MDDEQTRALYDDVAEGLAVYQRDAIAAYGEARLTEALGALTLSIGLGR